MSKKLAVGVDLGATNVRVVVGDRRGNILKKNPKKQRRTRVLRRSANKSLE